jgi:hypothetical protein
MLNRGISGLGFLFLSDYIEPLLDSVETRNYFVLLLPPNLQTKLKKLLAKKEGRLGDTVVSRLG